MHLDDEIGRPGPIYRVMERALWLLAPVLILIMALSIPSHKAAQEQADADIAREIAAENLEYCTKWGMPEGSPQHASCVRDLIGIRTKTEQRI